MENHQGNDVCITGVQEEEREKWVESSLKEKGWEIPNLGERFEQPNT